MNEVWQDRVLPQDIEAEQAALGSIFLDAETIIDAVGYIESKDFYRHGHQIIFETMIGLNDRDEVIDMVTIKDQLERASLLEDAGDLSYLSDLALAVPTTTDIVYYTETVEEKSLLHTLTQTTTGIVMKRLGQGEEVQTILDDAKHSILEVSERENRSGSLSIAEVLDSTIGNIDRLARNNEEIAGLPAGYQNLDKMTVGFQPEELIILATRPAIGKTAFALSIARNVGTKTDRSVAIFSLGAGAESLVNRMLCTEGSIEAGHLHIGQLSEEKWSNLIVAMGSPSRTNIFIDDTPEIKISEIRAECWKLTQEKDNLGLILIDYLQLIRGNGRENRQQEVSDTSRQLKKLARELRVPVIALSQLSRRVEQRQDKQPVLSGIRESGSIEQDADIVAFLYRDDYYEKEGGDDDDGNEPKNDSVIEVVVGKDRSGARRTVELLFIKEYSKFSSLSPGEEL